LRRPAFIGLPTSVKFRGKTVPGAEDRQPGSQLSRAGAQVLSERPDRADRFHVIRLVNHHFPNCWRD